MYSVWYANQNAPRLDFLLSPNQHRAYTRTHAYQKHPWRRIDPPETNMLMPTYTQTYVQTQQFYALDLEKCMFFRLILQAIIVRSILEYYS